MLRSRELTGAEAADERIRLIEAELHVQATRITVAHAQAAEAAGTERAERIGDTRVLSDAVVGAQTELARARATHDILQQRHEVLQQEHDLLQQQHAQVRNELNTERVMRSEALAALDVKLGLEEGIRTFTEWVATTPLDRRPLVSVILPTLGERPKLLSQSLASIRSQSHANFEVVVVGPTGLRLPTEFDSDSRFRVVAGSFATVGRSRNAGLAASAGEYIAYIDDDNTMGPHWLRAVVWSLGHDRDVDVVYGARLHESITNHKTGPSAFWHFEPVWRPELLEQFNMIDTNALAHRAGLAEARWDEDLPVLVDWDLAIRLTADGRVRPLPVRACTYTTGAMARLSDGGIAAFHRGEVVTRARAARPLRLLSYSHSQPRTSEAYIESEIAVLSTNFQVAAGSDAPGQEHVPSSVVHLGKLQPAIEQFRPDLLLFHYADVAARHRATCEREGVPYAVRLHSYDEAVSSIDDLLRDPFCLGIWAFPSSKQRLEESGLVRSSEGLHALPALFDGFDRLPHPPGPRSGVLYTSAALPKRNWEQLEQLLVAAQRVERRVILGTCDGHEEFAPVLAARIAAVDPRIDVRIDVPNADVLRLMAVTSSLVYLGSSTHAVGNPRSVVEAWLSGVIPLLPDTPDAHCFGGAHARYFSSIAQAAEIVQEIERAGTSLIHERTANLDHAMHVHASAQTKRGFGAEVRQAFARFEARQQA